MGSSLEIIDISASARRIIVDNRISLRFYFRIADNILKQANIFRAEKNIVDLYVMLLRFSSLALETIPSHQDYRTAPTYNKEFLKMRLLDVLTELEKLKPVVQQRINELNAKMMPRLNSLAHHHVNGSPGWSSVSKPSLSSYNQTKVVNPTGHNFGYMGPRGHQFVNSPPLEDHFRKMSVNFIRPKEETLSKHSIFGPNGLRAQWQPPKNDIKVQYPSNIDLTPIEIPSFQLHVDSDSTIQSKGSNHEPEKSGVESVDCDSSATLSENIEKSHAQEISAMISFDEPEIVADNNIIRQPSPPPILAEVQDLAPALCPQGAEVEVECKIENPLPGDSIQPNSPLELHISTTMMDTFMRLAKSNTVKNLETCGVLAGSLKDRKFHVTALIIPKQESTSNTCQTTNEEEIFEVQDKQSLFPLGWIHTHPTQSCFMSSVDLHTHYSYQIMLPESVAIVMAPTDTTRKHGIFRLTTPGGMRVIRKCEQRGFHPHDPPEEGGPIYSSCSDVYLNPSLQFDVIDLR
ncbi:PREDICTED: AMSH-like ubiquitin thioesterase 1 [Tarenaya hassleriana]|uniref:AMSH-like ubiquitin thioesterase 1 n=1 Tax=Tarenaya hassleriana TaxID=28532 RepID=UPI00053C4E40|nr:PREDICTED: AMSH-like ubiquitin thioesterase 1 [Tarenaya hassleriana]